MVETQIQRRGVTDETVLAAMRMVPRHRFVPVSRASAAYADCALPIGHGVTISQPYIVASMTAALNIDRPGLRVLEIGTGSGYQAAVLAECGCSVFSVERIGALHERAIDVLRDAGYGDRVHVRLADGNEGWPDQAPFDRIIVTAAAPEIPPVLVDQLVDGGVIVAPLGGTDAQVIRRCVKEGAELRCQTLEGVRFVPLLAGFE
jgi:protein-L-isoaspartate(D-aspartate) O-methyltransferase